MALHFFLRVKNALWHKQSRRPASTCSADSFVRDTPRYAKLKRVRPSESLSPRVHRNVDQRQVTILDMPDDEHRSSSTANSIAQSTHTRNKLFPIMLNAPDQDNATHLPVRPQTTPSDHVEKDGNLNKIELVRRPSDRAPPSFHSAHPAPSLPSLRSVPSSHSLPIRINPYTSSEQDERESDSSCNCSTCRRRPLKHVLPPRHKKLVLLVDSDLSLEINGEKTDILPYDAYMQARRAHLHHGFVPPKGSSPYVLPHGSKMIVRTGPTGDGEIPKSKNRNHSRAYEHERKITYGYTASEPGWAIRRGQTV